MESDQRVEEEFFTVKEVADKLKVPIRRVYKLIKMRQLISFSVGKLLRISSSDLALFVKEFRNVR